MTELEDLQSLAVKEFGWTPAMNQGFPCKQAVSLTREDRGLAENPMIRVLRPTKRSWKLNQGRAQA